MLSHLLRVGALGRIGYFRADGATRYPRGSRVVVRTDRGLELGEVLAPPDESQPPSPPLGTIVRAVTATDDLLQARLQKNRQAALDACARRIESLGLPIVLLDVEHLFDGQTLVFYFLGPTSVQLDQLTAELAEMYESKVQFRRFTEMLTQGCGPNCGTEAASGGCVSCASGCALAGACTSRAAAIGRDQ
jgi:cell fate regulator YaaT (PSP1 superfamily)